MTLSLRYHHSDKFETLNIIFMLLLLLLYSQLFFLFHVILDYFFQPFTNIQQHHHNLAFKSHVFSLKSENFKKKRICMEKFSYKILLLRQICFRRMRVTVVLCWVQETTKEEKEEEGFLFVNQTFIHTYEIIRARVCFLLDMCAHHMED